MPHRLTSSLGQVVKQLAHLTADLTEPLLLDPVKARGPHHLIARELALTCNP